MSNEIINYSLIKSIYENRKDYLDTFVPFLLISFPEDYLELNIDELPKQIEIKTGLKIPEFTINTIITRATRSSYLKRKEKKVLLTDKGKNFKSEIIYKRQEEERKINALIQDINNFINDKYSKRFSNEDIFELLLFFVRKYQTPLVNFFNSKNMNQKWDENIHENENFLIEYLNLAKTQKPGEFEILKRIFYGALISTIINKENISEINKKFSGLQIFLDTNFVFSIMDLHYPYICKPAKELFELLKKNNFKLKVFDFTINEMTRVLQRYTKESYKYFPDIKVDSIYSHLKSKGWTRDDCFLFISKIEKKINNLGIEIEYTAIDLDKYEIPEDDKFSKISQYKPEQNVFGLKHDICVIEEIKKRRKKPKREIETCEVIFLSSDIRLTNYNFIEFGHKENQTISEVISDRLFTDLLWLKSPEKDKEIPFEMVLSTQTELLIDRQIWDKFYDNLEKLKNENKITDSDITNLIYYHWLEEKLSSIQDPSKITPEFTLNVIEESKKEIDAEIQRKITEEAIKIEQKYTEEMAKRDEEYFRRINNIKINLRKKAERKARCFSNLIWGIPIILVIISIILIEYEVLTGSIISFISSILSSLGIQFKIPNVKKKIYDKSFNRIHKKLLAELSLEEIQN
jgi:hypothetical protein